METVVAVGVAIVMDMAVDAVKAAAVVTLGSVTRNLISLRSSVTTAKTLGILLQNAKTRRRKIRRLTLLMHRRTMSWHYL